MNIIIESFLKNHIKGYELTCSPQDAFEHFINYIVLRNFTSRHFDPDIIGTENGEVGIDGLAIVINDTIVTSIDEAEGIFNNSPKDVSVEYIFTQAKTSDNFKADEISLFLLAIKNFFGDKEKRIKMNPKMDKLANLSDYIFENAYKLNPNPICHMFYATNGTWTNDEILKSIIDEGINSLNKLHLFDDVIFNPYDQTKIIDTYRQIKNSIKKQIYIEQSAPIPEIDGVEEAYIGVVKCIDFISLISDEDGRLMVNLFEDNVRYFQGRNPVNLEIASTLSNATSQKPFALLNNGVTIVAKEIRRTGNTFSLTDFQIVNGCQTSFMLYNCRKNISEKTTMVIKLVATKDTELTGNIVKATNRQTPVLTEAFETLRTFHKDLELAYASYDSEYRLYYERRSKQYDADDINKNKIISFPVQINTYLAMFLGEPQSTHRYYGEILNAYNRKMFRENDVLEQYCISAIYLYYVERWLKENHKETYRVFKYHILLLLRCMIYKDELPPPNSKKMNELCKKLFSVLKDREIMDKTINMVLKIIDKTYDTLKSKIPDASNLPRSREFTNTMIQNLGVSHKNITQIDVYTKEINSGEIFDCKVIGRNANFVFVEIVGYKELGEIHISELDTKYVYDIDDIVKVNDVIKAKVLDVPKHEIYGYSLSKKRA